MFIAFPDLKVVANLRILFFFSPGPTLHPFSCIFLLVKRTVGVGGDLTPRTFMLGVSLDADLAFKPAHLQKALPTVLAARVSVQMAK